MEKQADRPSLLLVDDDETFCQVLASAFERRGFAVSVAHSVDAGLAAAEKNTPSTRWSISRCRGLRGCSW